jgi:hypothetical protein
MSGGYIGEKKQVALYDSYTKAQTDGMLDSFGVKHLSHDNAIINGDFRIWQRGTSFSTVANEYTADRWIASRGNGAATITREAFSAGQTDVPGEPQFYLRHARTTAASGGNAPLGQRIENARTFAGQQVTLSFWARCSASKTFRLRAQQWFGSGGSTPVDQSNQGITITPDWQFFTHTFTLASISGKTIGTGSYVAIRILEESGYSTFTLDIANVKIEPGSVATPFRARPIMQELALCQRYYEVQGGEINQQGIATLLAISTTEAQGPLTFKVEKRVAPALTAAGDFRLRSSGDSLQTTSIEFAATGTRSANINNAIVSSGLTAGQAVYLRSELDAGSPTTLGQIRIDAEI